MQGEGPHCSPNSFGVYSPRGELDRGGEDVALEVRNCGNVIEKGTPRLSEETREIGIPTLIHRYYDLRCALAVVPDVLRRSKPCATGSEPDLEARLDQQLEYANAQLARLARASR